MSLDRFDNFVDSLPLISILGLPIDDLKALKNVYDIVDASSFDGKLPRALIKVQKSATLATK